MQWLVVRTKPQQERIAQLHLRQREVEPYCPMFLEPPWHRRAPRGPVPLFKGYIFVRLDEPGRINAIRFCPGVLVTVAFDGVPAMVDQGLVDALRLREADRGYIQAREHDEGIPPGHKVRIMAGPLANLEGIFTGYLRGRERARVLLHFLRGQRELEVDAAALAMVCG